MVCICSCGEPNPGKKKGLTNLTLECKGKEEGRKEEGGIRSTGLG